MKTLQEILDNLPFANLPPAWQDHDLEPFSSAKRLWDYQQEALQYALKALWKYYEDSKDFAPDEPKENNEERKDRLWDWYYVNGLDKDLSIPLSGRKRDVCDLLKEYYPIEDMKIPYRHFINRMGFWMATGSGKSLVLIKLIEVLWQLMLRKEIPPHPVMVLTARNDLLDQLKAHVTEFNESRTDFRIHLEDLKAYPERDRMLLPLVDDHTITVFLYRADNLSDQQKDRIVDFRNYENGGRWYVLLDEAHKGDKEDSKRQHIYSILSRNGFLFNFSATFTDERDIATTAYNFNLSEFVRAGYGKHLCILKQENRAFKKGEDYTANEKQRTVLKALLTLACVSKAKESLPSNPQAYHRPLMLVLVNSVNTKDADLKLFFRELERIGQGDVDANAWKQAKYELWDEINYRAKWLFEGETPSFIQDQAFFDSITLNKLHRLVYNAEEPGAIEAILHPSNRQEIAFKLKNADRPFALIKIGDISGWLKDELDGYEVIESYKDEGLFRRLNDEDSPVNILMGSRTFYEGWDSNRPNVITFINIGTDSSARKFILQSTGRGVRVETLPGRRQRLLPLYNAGTIDRNTFQALRPYAPMLETLFIFGTNRDVLQKVMDHLNNEEHRHVIALKVNEKAVNQRRLFIPVYRKANRTILEDRAPSKFKIDENELNLLEQYVNRIRDPRLLVARHGATPKDTVMLAKCLNQRDQFFNLDDKHRYSHIDITLARLLAYLKVAPHDVDRFKPLENEIRHFQHIKVLLKDIAELKDKIQKVQSYQNPKKEMNALVSALQAGQISQDEFMQRNGELSNRKPSEVFDHNGQRLQIRHLARHYYLPVLISESERINWIKHVIRHPSEREFLNALEKHLEREDHAFKGLDWWVFSKLDESLDQVHIPYYDPQGNRIRRFLPDFVFWMQKGNRYAIVFVDPKGFQQSGYEHKVDGYCRLFLENGRPKTFCVDGLEISIHLMLYTKDKNMISEGYKEYWIDSPSEIPQPLI